MNAKEIAAAMKAAKTVESLESLLPDGEKRKTVLKAYEDKKAEFEKEHNTPPTGENAPNVWYQEVNNGEFLSLGKRNKEQAQSFIDGAYGHTKKGELTQILPEGAVAHNV